MSAVGIKEDMRTMLAAGGGMGVLFTEIELGLKIIVGLLTIAYLALRIYRLWKSGKEDE